MKNHPGDLIWHLFINDRDFQLDEHFFKKVSLETFSDAKNSTTSIANLSFFETEPRRITPPPSLHQYQILLIWDQF